MQEDNGKRQSMTVKQETEKPDAAVPGSLQRHTPGVRRYGRMNHSVRDRSGRKV